MASVACAAALVALAGCSSTRTAKLPTPQERAEATPMQADGWSKLGYRVDWRGFATMLPGSKLQFMDVLDDVVVAQESKGVLSALEVKNGSTRWSDQVSSALSRYIGNVRDGDRIISSTDSEAFYYDAQTGTLKARQALAVVCESRPVKIGDILVYGSATGQVLGHLTLNGYRQWGAMMDGPVRAEPLPLDNNQVALVSNGGDVVVLDGVTGLIDMKTSIALGSDAPMTTGAGALFVASVDHSLYALSRRDGHEVWRIRTDAPLLHRPVFHDGKVYCDMGDEGITAFDAASGKKLWNNPSAKGYVVAMRNKKLVSFDGAAASLLDLAKGKTLEKVELQNISVLKTDKFVDGNMYAGSPNGVIAKMATK